MEPEELKKHLWRNTLGRNPWLSLFGAIVFLIISFVSTVFGFCQYLDNCKVFESNVPHQVSTPKELESLIIPTVLEVSKGIKHLDHYHAEQNSIWIISNENGEQIDFDFEVVDRLFDDKYKIHKYSSLEYHHCFELKTPKSCPDFSITIKKQLRTVSQEHEEFLNGLTVSIAINVKVLKPNDNSIVFSKTFIGSGFGWNKPDAERRAISSVLEQLGQQGSDHIESYN